MNSTARWIALTAAALCLWASSASADPILWGRTRSVEPSGHGFCLSGGFCDVNQDTASLYTGQNSPPMVIDDTIFFGILVGATRTRTVNPAASASGAASALARAAPSTSVIHFGLTSGGRCVPEPGTALLIAAGCSLLGIRSGRKSLRRRPA